MCRTSSRHPAFPVAMHVVGGSSSCDGGDCPHTVAPKTLKTQAELVLTLCSEMSGKDQPRVLQIGGTRLQGAISEVIGLGPSQGRLSVPMGPNACEGVRDP